MHIMCCTVHGSLWTDGNKLPAKTMNHSPLLCLFFWKLNCDSSQWMITFDFNVQTLKYCAAGLFYYFLLNAFFQINVREQSKIHSSFRAETRLKKIYLVPVYKDKWAVEIRFTCLWYLKQPVEHFLRPGTIVLFPAQPQRNPYSLKKRS